MRGEMIRNELKRQAGAKALSEVDFASTQLS